MGNDQDYRLFLLEVRLGKLLRKPVAVNKRENEIQITIAGRWIARPSWEDASELLDEVDEAEQSFQAAWETLAKEFLVAKNLT